MSASKAELAPLVAYAPGRVNLIGGHVDYHEGPVVAMAIDLGVRCTFRRRDDDRIVVHSDDFDGAVSISSHGTDEPTRVEPRWGRLVAGVAAELARRGRPPVGMEAWCTSDLPIGCGLSSSAAFTVACALALARVAAWTADPLDIARMCQAAELLATGVPCGIQDQVASVAGERGSAVLLDCRDLSIEPIPIPDDVKVVIIDSGVSRTLEASPWAARRAESFTEANAIGVRVLRDATAAQVTHLPRARHVVDEIDRVWAFAAALRRRDASVAGSLMVASHESSRDLFESSVPELDMLVELLLGAGAFGARLTGGGFGGCVVALAPAMSAESIARHCAATYRARTQRTPTAFVSEPAAGATVLASPR